MCSVSFYSVTRILVLPLYYVALYMEALLSPRYLEYIKESVYRSLPRAQLGGVPGTYQLVRSYLTLRQVNSTPGLEVGRVFRITSTILLLASPLSSQDGSVDGQPVWAMVFYCMRCGDMDDALNAVSSAQ